LCKDLDRKGKEDSIVHKILYRCWIQGFPDAARDVRGFAVKFYTDEGNWDLVGNNIPVFFIQDAIKFPDLVHAIKPEPHNEMPQAQTAHDTFWDFVTLTPESTHMLMWIMSDRTIPRSFHDIAGFGVHTFRLVNAEGKARFVKFHWKPVAGTHSMVWDEAVKLQGADPDSHRRNLWESIEGGHYPEFEFGVQIVEEADADKLPFDILDSTKIIPEELVPIRYIGKMVLNRNPDDFHAETEQAVFHPGHVVPGIDFSEDPLLQGRLFSYSDTALHRVGTNFQQLPINRPVCPVSNHHRGGASQQFIQKGRVSYTPNKLGTGCPALAARGFRPYPTVIKGTKTTARAGSFNDHFSQARLFYNSMSPAEKGHILAATTFELQKVSSLDVRQRVVDLFNNVNFDLAVGLADNLGVNAPAAAIPATLEKTLDSPSLSVIRPTHPNTIKGRKVAILVAPGVDSSAHLVRGAIAAAGGLPIFIAPKGKKVPDATGSLITPDFTLTASRSVQFDTVFVPGGVDSVRALCEDASAVLFVAEAFKHLKPVAAANEGVELLRKAALPGVRFAAAGEDVVETLGIVTGAGVGTGLTEAAIGKVGGAVAGAVEGVAGTFKGPFVDAYVQAISKHRFWEREAVAAKVVA